MPEQASENQPQKRKQPLWKFLKWVAIASFLLLAILVSALAYLYTHQGPIKNAITKSLNEKLATEVSVGSIDIDFFSKFPEVSVKFTNVLAQEVAPDAKQPLFIFKGIFVRFGIWDLIDGDYTIRKLSFDEGEVNLRILPDGTDNWHFWKESSDTLSEEIAPIALEDVEWNNATFRFLDEGLNLRMLISVENVRIKGGFASGQLDATASGKLLLNDLTYGDLDLADEIPLEAVVQLLAHAEATQVTIEEVLLGNLNITGKGVVRDALQDWKIASSDGLLRDWMQVIPAQWRPKLNPSDISGKANATIEIALRSNGYELKSAAQLRDASFKVNKENILLKNVSGRFALSLSASGKKSTSRLEFTGLHADTQTGTLNLNATVEDLVAPRLSANGNFDVAVSELMAIARPGLLKEASGRVKGEFSYAQKFAAWDELRTRAFAEPYFTGRLEVENGRLRFATGNLELRDISAELELRNKDILINRLFLREGKSEFMLDGWFYNALYMSANRPTPTLSVRLQSEYLDLDRIMGWQMPTPEGAATAKASTGPAFNFNLALVVKQFNLIRFSGTNLKAEVWNDGTTIKGKNISFSGMGGSVNGAFSWANEDDGYRFWTKASVTKIDIHQAFEAFQNFGQNWLLADNIYGIGTVQLETSMAFNRNMDFITSSLKLASEITLENGRLVGYKPLLSLNSLVETKDLEDVRFDRLHNQISIANEVISIPQMEIKSTALNFVLLGKHSFDQQIDYSIRLAVADLIKKKKKKKTNLDDWIVEAETTDQPYIWVHVGCTVDNPCLSMDREMLKKDVKEEWKQQGEDIKNIFKPEDPKTKPKDPTKGELIFEWEEEEADTNKR
jgi:hypothetical protein